MEPITIITIILASIGTITSITVAFLHYSDRKDTVAIRADQSKAVYAKADVVAKDLTTIRNAIDYELKDLKVKTEELDDTLNSHLIIDAGISQKVDNLIELFNKLEIKLDKILEKVNKNE
jgi:hypothetical protein